MQTKSIDPFTCNVCGKPSAFSTRSTKLFFEMQIRTARVDDTETRTYLCEHCHGKNEITRPTGAWALLDLDRP